MNSNAFYLDSLLCKGNRQPRGIFVIGANLSWPVATTPPHPDKRPLFSAFVASNDSVVHNPLNFGVSQTLKLITRLVHKGAWASDFATEIESKNRENTNRTIGSRFQRAKN